MFQWHLLWAFHKAKIRRLALLTAVIPLQGVWAQGPAGTYSIPESLVDPTEKINWVKPNLDFCEGPAWDGENLYFSEIPKSTIWKVTPQGVASQFNVGLKNPNGIDVDPQGNLIVCRTGGLSKINKQGQASDFVTLEGDVNDIYVASTGAIWASSGWGGKFWYRSPTGELKQPSTAINGETNKLVCPNGIEWVEDKGFMIVVDYEDSKRHGTVYRYEVDKSTGNLSNGSVYSTIYRGDGCAMDELGNLWLAAPDSQAVFILDPNGKKIGKLSFPANGITNTVFGGTDRKTLYITSGGGLRSLRTKVAGRPKAGGLTRLYRDTQNFVLRPKQRASLSLTTWFAPDGRQQPSRLPVLRADLIQMPRL